MTPEHDALAAHAALALSPEEVRDLAAVPALLASVTDDKLAETARRVAAARDRAADLWRELDSMGATPAESIDAIMAWHRARVWCAAAAGEMRRRWPEAFAAPRLH